jgi:drug/metabolite transporter (DMT)-like permease
MEYLILASACVVSTTYNSLINRSGKKYIKNITDNFSFCALLAFFAALTLLIIGGKPESPSTFTIIWALAYGLFTVTYSVTSVLAMSCGPMSYTVLIICSALMLPTFSGFAFWHEKVAAVQIVGVAVLMVSIYLGANPKKDGRVTLKWFLLCLGAFASSGFLGIIQKIHQRSDYAGELNIFLFIAFAASVVLMTVICVVLSRLGVRKTVSLRSNILPLGAFTGICEGLVNLMMLYLAGKLASVILYPVYNGAALMLTALAASVIFKEKLSKTQTAGFILGVISIVLIGNMTANLF